MSSESNNLQTSATLGQPEAAPQFTSTVMTLPNLNQTEVLPATAQQPPPTPMTLGSSQTSPPEISAMTPTMQSNSASTLGVSADITQSQPEQRGSSGAPGMPVASTAPNPLQGLQAMLDVVHRDDIPEGRHVADVEDFRIEAAFTLQEEFRVTWRYSFVEGPLAGRSYEEDRPLRTAAMPHLRQALEVVTGGLVRSAHELLDVATNETGPIRMRVVGARIVLEASRRKAGDRTFLNLVPISLLQPAPGNTALQP